MLKVGSSLFQRRLKEKGFCSNHDLSSPENFASWKLTKEILTCFKKEFDLEGFKGHNWIPGQGSLSKAK